MLKPVDKEQTIGSRIEIALEARGRKPADVARDLGFHKSYISRVTNNQIKSPKKLVKALSDYLGVSEEWFFTGKGHPEKGLTGDSHHIIKDIDSSEETGSLYVQTVNDAEIQCYTGIESPLTGRNDLIVTSTTHDNGSGEYLCIYEGKACLMFRFNSNTKTLWKKKSFEDQPTIDPDQLKIVGKVIAFISPTISSIEQISHRFSS